MTAVRTPDIDWVGLSPILSLLAASGLALLGSVLVPQGARKAVAAGLTALGFVAAIVLGALVYADRDEGAL